MTDEQIDEIVKGCKLLADAGLFKPAMRLAASASNSIDKYNMLGYVQTSNTANLLLRLTEVREYAKAKEYAGTTMIKKIAKDIEESGPRDLLHVM